MRKTARGQLQYGGWERQPKDLWKDFSLLVDSDFFSFKIYSLGFDILIIVHLLMFEHLGFVLSHFECGAASLQLFKCLFNDIQ